MSGESMQAQYEDYIMHHGIKGQKWGVRKKLSSAKTSISNAYADYKKSNEYNPHYSTKQRRHDTFWYNSATTKSINRRMNKKGEDYKTASKHVKRQAFVNTSIALGTMYLSSPSGMELMHKSINGIKAVASYPSSRRALKKFLDAGM